MYIFLVKCVGRMFITLVCAKSRDHSNISYFIFHSNNLVISVICDRLWIQPAMIFYLRVHMFKSLNVGKVHALRYSNMLQLFTYMFLCARHLLYFIFHLFNAISKLS